MYLNVSSVCPWKVDFVNQEYIFSKHRDAYMDANLIGSIDDK